MQHDLLKELNTHQEDSISLAVQNSNLEANWKRFSPLLPLMGKRIQIYHHLHNHSSKDDFRIMLSIFEADLLNTNLSEICVKLAQLH